jgi:hypothetical protein
MTRTKKFVYRDMGVRPKNSYEMSFPSDMLALFQLKYKAQNPTDPEMRRRVCDIFGFMIKLAMKYLPPKQRKVFYSVWVRSGGKKKEGILEFSRKTGENYITNYLNYYKAVKNLKKVITKIGYDRFIIEYLQEGSMFHEDKSSLF